MRFAKKKLTPEAEPTAPALLIVPAPDVQPEPDWTAQERVVQDLLARKAAADREVADLEAVYRAAARQEAAGQQPAESALAILDRVRALNVQRDGVAEALRVETATRDAMIAENRRLLAERAKAQHAADFAKLSADTRVLAQSISDEWNALAGNLWRFNAAANRLGGPEFRDLGGPALCEQCWDVIKLTRSRALNSGRRYAFSPMFEVLAVEPPKEEM